MYDEDPCIQLVLFFGTFQARQFTRYLLDFRQGTYQSLQLELHPNVTLKAESRKIKHGRFCNSILSVFCWEDFRKHVKDVKPVKLQLVSVF